MRLDFETAWSELNLRLRALESDQGLTAAVLALERHQRDSGFIVDGLDQVERYTFHHPDDPTRFFRVQYNPRRALRFAGSGRQQGNVDIRVRNNGCFLCRENIEWQQRGIQFGYQIEAGERSYIALMNPFPLLPAHVTIAASEHRTQDWRFGDDGGFDVAVLLEDLVHLGARMPGHFGFYNGVGAGASIPGHLHYQFLMRHDDETAFPLEVAAERAGASNGGLLLGDHYPLDTALWKGEAATVAARASEWIAGWAQRNQWRLPTLSANFIAARDAGGHQVALYFVVRDRAKSRIEGFTGLVGGLEVLGEIVLSSPEEKARLTGGEIDYFTLEAALASVHTPIDLD